MPVSTLISGRYRRPRGRCSSLHACRTLAAVALGTATWGIGIAVGPAWATPATAQGARQLTDALARFVGRAPFDKGMITIAPQGDDYLLDAEIDSARLGLPADGPDLHFGPFHLLLTPRDDGTYAVRSDPAPMVLSFSSARNGAPVTFDERLEGCSGSGVFDPKLGVFSNYTASCEHQTLSVRTPIEDIDATLGKLSMQSHAEAGVNGGVDARVTADLADLVETITVKNTARPAPPMVIRSGVMHEDIAIKGLAADKILGIAALVAEKGTQARIVAAQDDIKSKTLAALPLWQDISGDIVLGDFSVGTPVGIVRAASIDEKVETTGLAKDGRYSVGLKVSGLSLPDGLVPDWAKPFVPTDGRLGFDVSGVDLDAMVRLVVQRFDARKHPPLPEDLRATLASLFAEGHPRLHFEQDLTAQGLDVKGQGDTSITPGQQGKATISASGLDGLIAALGQSTLPNKQHALLGLAFIKGLAKTGPDGRSVWDVEFDSLAKKITVNGQSFGSTKRP